MGRQIIGPFKGIASEKVVNGFVELDPYGRTLMVKEKV
jgi:hypothetical protein